MNNKARALNVNFVSRLLAWLGTIMLVTSFICFQIVAGELTDNIVIGKLFSLFLIIGVDLMLISLFRSWLHWFNWVIDAIAYSLILIVVQGLAFEFVLGSAVTKTTILNNQYFFALFLINVFLFKILSNLTESK